MSIVVVHAGIGNVGCVAHIIRRGGHIDSIHHQHDSMLLGTDRVPKGCDARSYTLLGP